MNSVDQIWRMRLVGRFSDLFKGHKGYPTCGDGWQKILAKMCERLSAAVADRPARSWIRVVDIKEKLGGLRVQLEANGIPRVMMDQAWEAIELAEAASEMTCEECGAPGRLFDERGWLQTRCDAHAAGEAVEPQAGHRDIHIRWTIAAGKRRLASCRRYDRATDSFIDVPLPKDIDCEED
jgi:hypothetical protein